MAFISNAQHVTLGDGVYNNVQGNLVHNIFLGRKRHRAEIEDGPELLAFTLPSSKRRRREDSQPLDGLKIIRNRHLRLSDEIGSGPGYFLHAGHNKAHAVIVKVFNAAPTAREQLERTAALSKGLMHPNVLRIEGISSPESFNHFIAYENVRWKNAEGPLAAALKDNVTESITLGFKMIAGLSSGMNYLSVQGISLASMGTENFDIFLDMGDRFLISINPPASTETRVAEHRGPEDNASKSWNLFNSLCQKVLRSANCVLHNDNVERNPDTIDFLGQLSVPQISESLPAHLSSFQSSESSAPTNTPNKPPVPPRREYVWRTIDRGQQSLSTVANRITLELDLKLSSINIVALSNTESPHRCAGYVREEITLTTTTGESAVVSHDSPSPLEICSVCREVVGIHEVFQCVCGDSNPGSRNTVKCRVCARWSHSDCVGSPKDFTCWTCVDPRSTASESASIPPINVLFAEVLQRQLAQPSAPPVRRPSAWPGFPGPDKHALSTLGYPHTPHTSLPPLRVTAR